MDTEHIFEIFSDLVSGKKPNSKFQLARIYGAYEREQEGIKKNRILDEELKNQKKNYSIHRISDDLVVVQYYDDIFKNGIEEWYCPAYKDKVSHNVYDSFDKALIAAISLKTNNLAASEYIFKMLGIENEVSQ